MPDRQKAKVNECVVHDRYYGFFAALDNQLICEICKDILTFKLSLQNGDNFGSDISRGRGVNLATNRISSL